MYRNGSTIQPPEGQIAVVYNLVPMPEAAGVAAGQGELKGVALAARGVTPAYLPADRAQQLSEISDLPRLYPDALLARAVEMRHGLPIGGPADCLRTLSKLVNGCHDRESLLYRPEFAIERAERALGEFDHRMQAVVDADLEAVYRNIELPTIEATADITRHGLLLDAPGLEAFYDTQLQIIDRTRREINAAAPRPLNPQDPNSTV